MGGFKLILGTPLNAVPRPWLTMNFAGIMVNAFDILSNSKRSEVRGRGLRRLLGISDDVELWIDSGGYQFLRRGMNPNPDKIIRLYREIDADYYVSLDYPPGPRDPPELRARKIAKTVSMFIEFRSSLRGITQEGRLVPVFHLSTGQGLEIQLREYEPTSHTAAIGGLIPHIMQRSGKGSRLKAVLFMLLVRRLWAGRLHALGLASAAMIPLLKAIGIDSGDTQTWRHKAAYGKIIIPGIGERHISGRKVRFGPAVLRSEEEWKKFREYLEKAKSEIGVTMESLMKQFESRALFNAWVLRLVASNGYSYNGSSKAFRNLHSTIEMLNNVPIAAIVNKLEELLSIQPVEGTAYRETRSIETAAKPVGGVAAPAYA